MVDWLIWMIRWRPYWLWLRKRQIIYEEVDTGRKKRDQRPEPARQTPTVRPESEFDDPFAADEIDPYAAAEQAAPADDDDPFGWDSGEDPYAAQAADSSYARPQKRQKTQRQTRRPASGGRAD